MTPPSLFSISSEPSHAFDPHWALYPRSYTIHRAPVSFHKDCLDGDLTKAIWDKVPWSAPFADIQGKDGHDNDDIPLTRFKALWDDEYIYIGAELHPANFATQAHFTQRNSPIFQKDSDFEVFVDADSSHHNYKELELNALNTVWNLLMDKPYRDGGTEHSGRVAQPGETLYYDVTKQRTAVRIVAGQLNDKDNVGVLWTVELALSYDDLLARCNPPFVPQSNSIWRVNFSRVERQGQINWTWQQQRVWDPAVQKHVGKIEMHLPDAWGYFVFSLDPAAVAVSVPPAALLRDSSWPARLAAMNVYYAQQYYKEQHGVFANSLDELVTDAAILQPFDIVVLVSTDNNEFSIRVTDRIHGVIVSCTNDRLVRVETIVPGQTGDSLKSQALQNVIDQLDS